MKDNVGQSAKKTTVKRIVIGIIIACVIAGSSVVVLNWNRIEPTVEKIIQSTSSEPTNITESTQKTIKKSKKSKDKKSKQRKQKATEAKIHTYILNSNTGKFHRKNCEYADTIAEHNKKITKSTREELIELGWQPCYYCQP